MIIHSNLSKMKHKILSTCLQRNYIVCRLVWDNKIIWKNSAIRHMVCLGLGWLKVTAKKRTQATFKIASTAATSCTVQSTHISISF